MTKQITFPTRQVLEAFLKMEINALSISVLRQVDELGARVYIYTDHDGDPVFDISLGNPDDRAFHEWADNQVGPKAHKKWECSQEFKTSPKEMRAFMQVTLPEDLIDPYQVAVAEYSQD